jgi:hypothetical protein
MPYERYGNNKHVAEKDPEARENRSDEVVRLPNCETLPVLLVGKNYCKCAKMKT